MKTEKTKIMFEWEGQPITLEYTADSLRKMEKRGFDISKVEARLLTVGETLFSGAFIANHDDIKESVRREIYHEFSEVAEDNGESIIDALTKMFEEAIDELQSHKGNVKWRMAK